MPDLVQVVLGAGHGLLARQLQDMHGRFDDVLHDGHVRPQVEVLKDHRQRRAEALQLLVIRDQGAAAVGAQADRLAVDADAPLVRMFQEIDAAQEGAFPRAGRADDADDIAALRLERNALEDFLVAVALVDVLGNQRVVGVGRRGGVHDDFLRRSGLARWRSCVVADVPASAARRGGTGRPGRR
jgi:hypothetical protein